MALINPFTALNYSTLSACCDGFGGDICYIDLQLMVNSEGPNDCDCTIPAATDLEITGTFADCAEVDYTGLSFPIVLDCFTPLDFRIKICCCGPIWEEAIEQLTLTVNCTDFSGINIYNFNGNLKIYHPQDVINSMSLSIPPVGIGSTGNAILSFDNPTDCDTEVRVIGCNPTPPPLIGPYDLPRRRYEFDCNYTVADPTWTLSLIPIDSTIWNPPAYCGAPLCAPASITRGDFLTDRAALKALANQVNCCQEDILPGQKPFYCYVDHTINLRLIVVENPQTPTQVGEEINCCFLGVRGGVIGGGVRPFDAVNSVFPGPAPVDVCCLAAFTLILGLYNTFRGDASECKICDCDIFDDPEFSFSDTHLVIPAGGSGQITITYSPTIITPANCCEFRVDVCSFDITAYEDVKAHYISLCYEADAGDPCLVCTTCEYETKDDLLPSMPNICGLTPDFRITNGSIGDIKVITCEYKYEFDLDPGFTVYANWFLFGINCPWGDFYGSGNIDAYPQAGWYINYYPAMTPGTFYPMTLYGAGANANSQKNIQAYFTPVLGDATRFKIRLEFWLIMDIDNPIWINLLDNSKKLLRNHIGNAILLDNGVQSVYNTDKVICSMVYVVDQANQPSPGVDNECYYLDEYPVSYRFYNEGLYSTALTPVPAEMTDPTFYLSRWTLPVSDFSTVYSTQLNFDITYGSTPTGLSLLLIDTTNADNGPDFLTNYDLSMSRPHITGPAGAIDNHFNGPAVSLLNAGAGLFRSMIQVNVSVQANHTYRVIAVVFDDVANLSNSFISDEITVTEIPNICCSPDTTPAAGEMNVTFYNYRGNFGNTQPILAPQERARLSGFYRFNTLLSCYQIWYNQWYPGEPARTFTDLFNEIDKIDFYITSRYVDFPAVGSDTAIFWETRTAPRQLGFPGNWNVPADTTVSENLITGTLTFDFNYRMRYEENLKPTEIYTNPSSDIFNRTQITGPLVTAYNAALGTTYYWGGNSVLDYRIWAQVTFNFTDCPAPFTQVFLTRNLFQARPYENDDLTPFVDEIVYISPDTGLVIPLLCKDELLDGVNDSVIVRVHRSDNLPGGTLAAFIDKPTFGINNLEEENAFISPSGFAQLDSNKLFDVDIFFGAGGYAFFKVNLLNLPTDLWQISAKLQVP